MTHDFYMPAEFERQQAAILIFPERPGSWGYGAVPAQKVFAQIINTIALHEDVYVIVSDVSRPAAEKLTAVSDRVHLLDIPTNDAWARDTAPTFVKNGRTGEVRGISWKFNAWGGEYDGLYAHWELDDALAETFCKMTGFGCISAGDFVLEGGSIHSDGEGTILTTESCLLSGGRNPSMTKAEIERTLCEYLGGKKVIWLPRGIFNDETNEHVDNVCAFIRPAEVVLAWTDDRNDPQYELSAACLETLENCTDAKGRKIIVHKLPIPDTPVCVTEHDLAGYTFEDGEDIREVGERLAASYVNFFFANDIVLLPQFGGENAESDARAVNIMRSLLPDREIVPIDAVEIIKGGGNIHCITQQIPDRQKWRWCLIGNIVDEHEWGEEHTIRHGTKHFLPGTKVYIELAYPGMGNESIVVIGMARHTKKYIEVAISGKYVHNFRLGKVFKPAVLKRMENSKFKWWGTSDEDRDTIAGCAEFMNKETEKK